MSTAGILKYNDLNFVFEVKNGPEEEPTVKNPIFISTSPDEMAHSAKATSCMLYVFNGPLHVYMKILHF